MNIGKKFIIIFLVLSSFQLNVFSQRIGDYLQLAKIELDKENYLKAIYNLNQAIRMRPASYEGYFLRGYAKYRLDDYIGAEQDFTDAAQFDPFNSEIYHYRAIVKSQQYNFGGALEDFAKAIELNPNDPYIHLNRGRSYLFLKDFEKTIEDCNRAIELKYKKDNVYILRGMAESGLEQYDGALQDFNLAISKNKENTQGYIQRGIVRIEMKQPDSALIDFNKALDKNPNDSYAMFNRSMARMELADTTGAFEDLNNVIDLSPYNSYAYYNRAILKVGTGDEQGAIEDLNKVIAFNPDNIVVYLFRGRLKRSLGDLKGSVDDYSKAIEIYPDFADAYYERSQVKRQMMDLKGADKDREMAYAINEFHFNDSLKLQEAMYLKRLIALSGDFYDEKKPSDKVQDQYSDIEMIPAFSTVLFSKNIENISLFDTFGKKMYHSPVITLIYDDSNINTSSSNAELQKIYQDTSLLMDPENYYKKAVLLSHIQNYKQAIQEFDNVITLDPGYLMAYFDRANTRLKLVDLINSADDFDFKVGGNQDEVNFHGSDKSGIPEHTYEKIIQDYNKVIDLDAGFYFAYFNRGYVKAKAGNYWGAVSDFTKAIEMDPKFGEAHFNKGLILLLLKVNNVACNDLSQAGELGIEEAFNVIKRYCVK